jgi:hypothetical protein
MTTLKVSESPVNSINSPEFRVQSKLDRTPKYKKLRIQESFKQAVGEANNNPTFKKLLQVKNMNEGSHFSEHSGQNNSFLDIQVYQDVLNDSAQNLNPNKKKCMVKVESSNLSAIIQLIDRNEGANSIMNKAAKVPVLSTFSNVSNLGSQSITTKVANKSDRKSVSNESKVDEDDEFFGCEDNSSEKNNTEATISVAHDIEKPFFPPKLKNNTQERMYSFLNNYRITLRRSLEPKNDKNSKENIILPAIRQKRTTRNFVGKYTFDTLTF